MTDPDIFSNAISSTRAGSQTVPALLLVSTPIGNLRDMSFRGIEALTQVDAILCEDTRTSGVLMAAHGIKTKLMALHDHNEEARIPGLIAAMQGGARYALISDAGTPLVSDPGFRLTRAAIDAGIPVGGIPGANAAVMALTLSGLPPHPFLFSGFLPVKTGPRQSALTRLANAEAAGLAATLIFYEAPHRLAETLADAAAIFGPRPAAVCRELTKHFEEVVRDSLPNLAARYAVTPPRGEITLVIGPATAEPASAETLDAALAVALAQLSLKDAVDAVTAATGLPRRQVYARALGLSREA
ncbi:MAG TPA: 16S rRNA (cytidine(1402)-2'-O)-methyltransferase [Acidocella sp.]|nr:MAG: 16S rRNA (cytidine(1402)-2'-O)-methyltransferase [Acidocella sp. 20-58-15]HQT37819.1 16S rRNA (cytidine(1402)-2'-O)-methyltransferase [Acidocella sp.]